MWCAPSLESGAVCGLGVVSFFLPPIPAPTHPTQFHPQGLPDSRPSSKQVTSVLSEGSGPVVWEGGPGPGVL